MRPGSPRTLWRWPFVTALLLIILVAAGLRLYRLPELPLGLHYDEAANGILAAEIARGIKTPVFIPSYTGKEVLFFYWAALWVKLLGATPLALRLSAALVGLATVAASVWAVRELEHGRRDADWIALSTGAFLATSFWHLVLSRYGFRAVTQPLMQALTVAALWRGLRCAGAKEPIGLKEPVVGVGAGGGGKPWLLLAGLFGGLTAYTYLAARAFPIPLAAALLALLIAERGRRRRRLGQLALFVAFAALTVAPLAHYWVTHPGSFLTRTQQVAVTSWAGAWAGLRACLGMFFVRGDPYVRFNLPHRPLLDPATAALFVFGIIIAIKPQVLNPKSANRQMPVSTPVGKSPISDLQSATPSLHLATRVFLLANLLIMLLPSALASGEITPSNLRAVGLLPFIYVLPAKGLSAIATRIGKSANVGEYTGRQISKSANRKCHLLFAICHLSFVILILAFLTPTTASAYFREWAASAALYKAADGDLVDVAAYLNEADLATATPYVASIHYRHPTVAFLAEDYGRVRWLTGGRTVVFPAVGDGLLVFPRSASKDVTWVESVLPAGSLVAAPPGPDGKPAFRAYRTAPGPGPAPTRALTADLAHVASLLGYDVIGEPRSGAKAEVALWWRVLNRPTAGDYGPLARLTDAWGCVWGEAQPFHYPGEQWTPGEVVVDHLSIPIAPGAPPGDYQVRFGFYSGGSDSLLPVLGEGDRYAGTFVGAPVRVGRAATPPAVEDLSIRTRLDARIGGPTLLGANLDTISARPGEKVFLTLFWRAEEVPLPDTHVRLTLGEALLYTGGPVHGTYPTSRWGAGEVVADRYDLRLARDMPPGDHFLWLNLENSAAGSTASQPLNLGTVAVRAIQRAFDVPAISHPLSAALGGQVELLGYDLEAGDGLGPAGTIRPGDTLTLTLYWRALAEMDEDYTVFTHLLAEDGSLAGQRDGQPVGGTYPTSLWVAGEVVRDVREVTVRADATPGTYRLEVGMYVAESGGRLPVFGTNDTSILLQTVMVVGLQAR